MLFINELLLPKKTFTYPDVAYKMVIPTFLPTFLISTTYLVPISKTLRRFVFKIYNSFFKHKTIIIKL